MQATSRSPGKSGEVISARSWTVEQGQLQVPVADQRLDLRGAQRGDPVQARGADVLAQPGGGQHAPVPDQHHLGDPEPVLDLGHLGWPRSRGRRCCRRRPRWRPGCPRGRSAARRRSAGGRGPRPWGGRWRPAGRSGPRTRRRTRRTAPGCRRPGAGPPARPGSCPAGRAGSPSPRTGHPHRRTASAEDLAQRAGRGLIPQPAGDGQLGVRRDHLRDRHRGHQVPAAGTAPGRSAPPGPAGGPCPGRRRRGRAAGCG